MQLPVVTPDRSALHCANVLKVQLVLPSPLRHQDPHCACAGSEALRSRTPRRVNVDAPTALIVIAFPQFSYIYRSTMERVNAATRGAIFIDANRPALI